jgi:DNA-binding HxlR family transcriptional regulator
MQELMNDILAAHPNAVSAFEALEALGGIDEAIHQKARMGIMSLLLALGEADFKLLKETLGLSDGNLSTHLTLLEDRGYIEVQKEFIRKKPRTTYRPTEAGRNAFQRYILALERIVKASSDTTDTE